MTVLLACFSFSSFQVKFTPKWYVGHNCTSLTLKAFKTLSAYLHIIFKIRKFLDAFNLVKERPNKSLDITLFGCSRGVCFVAVDPRIHKLWALVYVTWKRSYTIDFSSWISSLNAVKIIKKDEYRKAITPITHLGILHLVWKYKNHQFLLTSAATNVATKPDLGTISDE